MSGVNAGWTLVADEVLALPVDELAMLVLRDAVEFSNGGKFSPQGWLTAATQGYPERAVHLALAEAWQWLKSRGFCVGDPGASTDAWQVLTATGQRALDEGIAAVRAADRLNVDLHPRIAAAARGEFLQGRFAIAAFAALREVEIRVRDLSGVGDLLGVKLMRTAFQPAPKDGSGGGPLTDANADNGEQVALMELFAGAVGSFKNPPSHREVDYDDATEAAEVVLLADLLMRILDRIERRADT
jgi:uncharacterized protein (TIGR02391 family)